MTKTELAGYMRRYADLDKEWCTLYDNKCETGKVAKRMKQIQIEIDAIIDEAATKLGITG